MANLVKLLESQYLAHDERAQRRFDGTLSICKQYATREPTLKHHLPFLVTKTISTGYCPLRINLSLPIESVTVRLFQVLLHGFKAFEKKKKTYVFKLIF